jgi:hypothetical protein
MAGKNLKNLSKKRLPTQGGGGAKRENSRGLHALQNTSAHQTIIKHHKNKLPLMKKITLLLAVASGILLSQEAKAALVVTTTQTADNQQWPSLPSGYLPYTPGGVKGLYDAFSIQVNGTPGEAINSLSFGFAFSGLFDDSVAFDLNGDGTIDWAGDFFDIYHVRGNSYQPWANLADAQNTKVYLTIGPTSSSVTLKVYDQTITQGLSTNPDADNLNNVGAITLASLGFPGTIPGGGSATSANSIRVGFVNTSGGGEGIPSINTSDFFTGNGGSAPAAVPEPGQVAASLLLLAGIGGYVFLKRRKAAKPALAQTAA